MSDLRREIDELSGQRSLRRARREKNKVPVVALVGYTNAGKSTLLNTLSGADVLAEDKLQALQVHIEEKLMAALDDLKKV